MFKIDNPWWQPEGHTQTIFPVLIRKRKPAAVYVVHIVPTPDNDVLYSRHYKAFNTTTSEPPKAVVLCHGLEGDYDAQYILGMAAELLLTGFDVITWCFRGCGPVQNLQPKLYHSGATYDLATIVDYFVINFKYDVVGVLGFSLGSNLSICYASEALINPAVKAVVGVSVPLELNSCSKTLETLEDLIYKERFLKSLKGKIKAKALQFPALKGMAIAGGKAKTIILFDDAVTAPLGGFKDALTYYRACSSLYRLPELRVNTLIISAINDPILASDCFPAEAHPYLTYCFPENGGHCGFMQSESESSWAEIQAANYLERHLLV